MLELYRNIKKYRKLNNMTQLELAEAIGYSDRSIISKIENGGIDLTQSQIIKFADVFGISPGTLMGNDGTLDHMDQLTRANAGERKAAQEIRSAEDKEKDISDFIRNFDNFTAAEKNEIARKVIRSAIWDGETLKILF